MINKRKSFWLCLFLGWLGVHRFYERKYVTGVLYLCTFGLFGIGWILDLLILSMNPNKPVTESYQYNTYLKVVEALQKNGYTVSEFWCEWCEMIARVERGSVNCGYIFVLAYIRPGFVLSLVGCIFRLVGYISREIGLNDVSPSLQGNLKRIYESNEYEHRKRRFIFKKSQFESKGYDFDSYHYWPDDSLIAGIADSEMFSDTLCKPTEDNKWLGILKSVIGVT